ncbi:MAG: hypothetical protein QGG97_04375 [Flavobacteriales bacterium]|jgi:hypothetical protein|nr:hypothetical protein [Flavobacteriales bacterium]|tara:strand:- start:169 stop:330 length:162 start_codon:yes stop_codon:yes gene_type:complete
MKIRFGDKELTEEQFLLFLKFIKELEVYDKTISELDAEVDKFLCEQFNYRRKR